MFNKTTSFWYKMRTKKCQNTGVFGEGYLTGAGLMF